MMKKTTNVEVEHYMIDLTTRAIPSTLDRQQLMPASALRHMKEKHSKTNTFVVKFHSLVQIDSCV